ncbi:class I SAM-dependent methyltransferase [Flagellimonas amoyensis]|uniref:class I SAM-dependent methyltransferase n=1 Tax=Flagellimonas amoyensis TaxID=2169401 RepID=UPI000D33922C|nr:class I SAM-dependent methyltransferase [Allomuricauda amoyensis]
MEYPADFWNERYGEEEYVYGIQPNEFFKEQINKLKPGKILLPAEGEGRNAIYAASLGWDVVAFDISEKGREKALGLAADKQVKIYYSISDVLEFHSDSQFDAMGLCYAHFPAEIRKQAHLHLMQFLKPDGIVIFEAFAKAQMGKASGGPKNKEMLFSIEEVKTEFPDLDFKLLKEKTIELSEGNYHKGKAEVIQFMGVK